MITREQIIKWALEAGFSEKQWKAMTYESGPYDITEPTVSLDNFANLVAQHQKERDAQILEQHVNYDFCRCPCECASAIRNQE